MSGEIKTDIEKILKDYYQSFQKDGEPISVNFRTLVPELKKAAHGRGQVPGSNRQVRHPT